MMYQTVGSSAVEYIAKAMNLPFFIGTTTGEGRSINKDYTPTQVQYLLHFKISFS